MSLLATSVPATSTAATDGAQNNTNGSTCFQIQISELNDNVLLVYVLLIIVLGIVFNVFVLMVFCFHKKPCTVPEIYLSNLAAADLFLVFSMPFGAVSISRRYNWTFGWFACKVVNLNLRMNMSCSIYFLVLVSTDRYLALVHPMSRNRMRSPKFAKLGCLLVWGLGLLLNVPTFIYRTVQSGCDYAICFFAISNKTNFLVYDGILIVIFIIPIPVISFCTVKIIQALKSRLTEGLNRQKIEHKATTLVVVVLLAFLICWAPFLLLWIIRMLSGVLNMDVTAIEILDTCSQISFYVACFNSALNPILYVIVGKSFQKKVKELFKQWNGGVTSNMAA